jgi:uncharacterized membrane protein
MVERLYAFLESVGFHHPLHPMLTHIPMGMIIGMVVFALIGLLWKNNTLVETAFHCSVLALLSIAPVIIAGIFDWLHRDQGQWNKFIIIKMILAAFLTIFLTVSVVLKKKGVSPGKVFLIYLLCLACAGGLGYSGGTLVYG